MIKSTFLKLLKNLGLTILYSTVLDLLSARFSVINYLQYNSYRLYMYKIFKETGITCCILWSLNSELESFFDVAVLHWICYVTVMQQFAN